MKSILISIFLCFVSISIYSQTNEIKGTISDRNGTPLPGVSVIQKGTSHGTTTNFDGEFALSNINMGETLVFSYIGFSTKEIVVTNFEQLNVVLDEDTQNLEEVVVVGYGVQKKT